MALTLKNDGVQDSLWPTTAELYLSVIYGWQSESENVALLVLTMLFINAGAKAVRRSIWFGLAGGGVAVSMRIATKLRSPDARTQHVVRNCASDSFNRLRINVRPCHSFGCMRGSRHQSEEREHPIPT